MQVFKKNNNNRVSDKTICMESVQVWRSTKVLTESGSPRRDSRKSFDTRGQHGSHFEIWKDTRDLEGQ